MFCSKLLPALIVGASLLVISSQTKALVLQGQTTAHDPSRITKCGNRYYVYTTGNDVPMMYSDDMVHWQRGKAALSPDGVPAWAHTLVPTKQGNQIWAPDVLFFNGTYHLYYAFADWNSNYACIGLVTSPTLDPDAANYKWTDQGCVVASDPSTVYNTIDPCPVFDQNGRLWLVFGSMAKGTRLIPLDTHTGLRSPGTDMYQFAGHEGEAGYVYYRKGYYYFFKNLGHCCAGLNSTSYRILVGRSHQITGPYVDKDGNDLATHPGTIFLQTDGDKIGPGQIGIYTDSGVDYVSFHYYSRALGGRPTLGIETLTWDADGWPVAGKDPQPPATVP